MYFFVKNTLRRSKGGFIVFISRGWVIRTKCVFNFAQIQDGCHGVKGQNSTENAQKIFLLICQQFLIIRLTNKFRIHILVVCEIKPMNSFLFFMVMKVKLV